MRLQIHMILILHIMPHCRYHSSISSLSYTFSGYCMFTFVYVYTIIVLCVVYNTVLIHAYKQIAPLPPPPPPPIILYSTFLLPAVYIIHVYIYLCGIQHIFSATCHTLQLDDESSTLEHSVSCLAMEEDRGHCLQTHTNLPACIR